VLRPFFHTMLVGIVEFFEFFSDGVDGLSESGEAFEDRLVHFGIASKM
jgi:hypothetical protein